MNPTYSCRRVYTPIFFSFDVGRHPPLDLNHSLCGNRNVLRITGERPEGRADGERQAQPERPALDAGEERRSQGTAAARSGRNCEGCSPRPEAKHGGRRSGRGSGTCSGWEAGFRPRCASLFVHLRPPLASTFLVASPAMAHVEKCNQFPPAFIHRRQAFLTCDGRTTQFLPSPEFLTFATSGRASSHDSHTFNQ